MYRLEIVSQPLLDTERLKNYEEDMPYSDLPKQVRTECSVKDVEVFGALEEMLNDNNVVDEMSFSKGGHYSKTKVYHVKGQTVVQNEHVGFLTREFQWIVSGDQMDTVRETAERLVNAHPSLYYQPIDY